MVEYKVFCYQILPPHPNFILMKSKSFAIELSIEQCLILSLGRVKTTKALTQTKPHEAN